MFLEYKFKKFPKRKIINFQYLLIIIGEDFEELNTLELMSSTVADVLMLIDKVTHFKIDGESREMSGYICMDIENNEIEVQVFEQEIKGE